MEQESSQTERSQTQKLMLYDFICIKMSRIRKSTNIIDQWLLGAEGRLIREVIANELEFLFWVMECSEIRW